MIGLDHCPEYVPGLLHFLRLRRIDLRREAGRGFVAAQERFFSSRSNIELMKALASRGD